VTPFPMTLVLITITAYCRLTITVKYLKHDLIAELEKHR
jgi:hypothetical protein